VLSSLKLKNFRAFKDQSFHFRKLNIFIGKNNSGKSSAISALNLIAQTVSDESLDGTPLILNGSFDKLGTFIDVVNGNNPRRKIGLELTFDKWTIRTEYKYRSQRRQIELSEFELIESGTSQVKFGEKKDSYDLIIQGRPIEKLLPGMKKRRPRFRNFWPASIIESPGLRSPEERDSSGYRALRAADMNLF